MTLLSALHRGHDTSLGRAALIALAGSLLLTLSAKAQVPFWPVPMTMQTFVVIGLGLALGPRLGLAAVALYLAQGAAGLPVFAGTPEKGIGLAYMAGPTGGYLAGYLLAAFVAGHLAMKGWDRNPLTAFAAALVAGALIYLPGLAWLGAVVGREPTDEWRLLLKSSCDRRHVSRNLSAASPLLMRSFRTISAARAFRRRCFSMRRRSSSSLARRSSSSFARRWRSATAAADYYLSESPTDGIPYWDTGAPGLVHLKDYRQRPADPFNEFEPVDSSAAAIS